MAVIRLSENVINRIAAGEVIERPASVVKELVENAIDAGARHIEITTEGGGKSLLRVHDDGCGMGLEDLRLAVERHCTSKLATDLTDIRTLGFRGEALPSIAAVSRFRIASRTADSETGWQIEIAGGTAGPARPAAMTPGTQVEVRDLFFATPARLKFLRTDQAEATAVTELVKRTAIAFPGIRFTLAGSDRAPLDYSAGDAMARLRDVLGPDIGEHGIALDAGREGVRLTGIAGLPTWHRGNARQQFFYVNGRPVRDRQLAGAVRGAYGDLIPRDRHPVVVLFLALDPGQVDVNVHPAKSDVRFRDPGLVRGLIVGAIREAVAASGPRPNRSLAGSASAAFRRGGDNDATWTPANKQAHANFGGFAESQAEFRSVGAPSAQAATAAEEPNRHPLGAARAQLHENYIVAQTEDGLVIVDQHAAHERLVFEKLKAGFDLGVASQILLIPEIVELPQEDAARIGEHSSEFEKLGLSVERFGPNAVAVRATPAILGEVDCRALVRDLADEIAEWAGKTGLRDRLESVASRIACHGSVRSGRRMKAEEMNALLRQMETTPNSGQCNHGRPTFIELKLADIERLFGR